MVIGNSSFSPHLCYCSIIHMFHHICVPTGYFFLSQWKHLFSSMVDLSGIKPSGVNKWIAFIQLLLPKFSSKLDSMIVWRLLIQKNMLNIYRISVIMNDDILICSLLISIGENMSCHNFYTGPHFECAFSLQSKSWTGSYDAVQQKL